ncbi:hypothetical protein WA158_005279 [Blastocystis sp. Blastoise]
MQNYPVLNIWKHILIFISLIYFSIYLFLNLFTPIVERKSLFVKTVGENTDITHKEMYEFKDKSDEEICLRPEYTAGVNRALLNNNYQQSLPQKYYYYGPVFRYERPQKGRYRQFTQFGGEYIGEENPYIDADLILMNWKTMQDLHIDKGIKIHINSLGDRESMNNYYGTLKNYMSTHINSLSKESQYRYSRGSILRILDSKEIEDQEIIKNAPLMINSFNNYSKQYFETVFSILSSYSLPLESDPHLVRGLDYYQHTTFEFINQENITVLAGGRYDLSASLNYKNPLPSIGWSAGVERVALTVAREELIPSEHHGITVYNHYYNIVINNIINIIINIDKSDTPECISILRQKQLSLAHYIRNHNIPAYINYNTNIKKALKIITSGCSKYCIFLSKDDKEDSIRIKNLQTMQQETISMNSLIPYLNQK